MKRKQQNKKTRVSYIPGMWEPIPCNEQKYSFLIDLQGHLMLICIWKHVHRDAQAHRGASIPRDQSWLGWSISSLSCRVQAVGVRAWVSDECIWRMESKMGEKMKETAEWCHNRTRSSPGPMLWGPNFSYFALSAAWAGCLPSCRRSRRKCTHSYQTTLPSRCLIHGVEGSQEWFQIPQCFSCWRQRVMARVTGKHSPTAWISNSPGDKPLRCACSCPSFFTTLSYFLYFTSFFTGYVPCKEG